MRTKIVSIILIVMMMTVGISFVEDNNVAASEFVENIGNVGLSPNFTPNDVAWNEGGTMAVVVGVARAIQSTPLEPISAGGWSAVFGLGVVTALSRLFMFLGLGRLGGIQTALLGLTELFVTLLVAFLLLNERLTLLQWLGGGLLITAGVLVRRDSRPILTSEEWMAALEAEAELARRALPKPATQVQSDD